MMIRVSVLAVLIAGALASAAPIPQPFHRALAFEPNRGQAGAPGKGAWGYRFIAMSLEIFQRAGEAGRDALAIAGSA